MDGLSSDPSNLDVDTIQPWTIHYQLPTGDYLSPFSNTKMYPVTAGNHTFYLWGFAQNSLSIGGDIDEANITAHYVKNRF
ncbi:MAG: hypothetical protein M3305_11185 [Actinomycetota bacterium]|jgi:hypothetical protein|nr:hypothetical protein [Actinomycetota bacterium]